MIHQMKLNESPFERIKNKTESMLKYYSHKQEKEYGVVGIKIKLLEK